jgi:hypothetical protein
MLMHGWWYLYYSSLIRLNCVSICIICMVGRKQQSYSSHFGPSNESGKIRLLFKHDVTYVLRWLWSDVTVFLRTLLELCTSHHQIFQSFSLCGHKKFSNLSPSFHSAYSSKRSDRDPWYHSAYSPQQIYPLVLHFCFLLHDLVLSVQRQQLTLCYFACLCIIHCRQSFTLQFWNTCDISATV